MLNTTRILILGIGLVILAIVLIIGGKTDAERDNPDRQMTPMRDQWPISMLFGKDFNLRSISAVICILIGFGLQIYAFQLGQ